MRERTQVPFWLRNGHVQTILGHWLRKRCEVAAGKEIDIPLPDGDELAAELLEGPSDTIVYLFHGLGGSICSGYMLRAAKLCHELGHTVMRVNHRGCGRGSELTHKNPYHSGRAEDLSEAIAFGKKLYPNKKHIAIGYSLSGNALLLLISGERGNVQPDAAIAVNAPIELSAASRKLGKGLNRIYDFVFVADCKRDFLTKQKRGWIPRSFKLPRRLNLATFDEIYTAPMSGFENREHYYTVCSTARHLHRITRPTLLITAKDDPFVDVKHYHEAKLSPSVRLIVSEVGGHMGYLTRGKRFYQLDHWLENQIRQGIKELTSRLNKPELSRGA